MGVLPRIRFRPKRRPEQDSNIGDKIGEILAARLLTIAAWFLQKEPTAGVAVHVVI